MLKYARPGGGYLFFGLRVVLCFEYYRQDQPDLLEAGGVLLGRYDDNGQDVHIVSVSTPHPDDIRTRNSFQMVSDHHQNVVDQQFVASEGTELYAGGWHTHPEAVPYPSNTDLATWSDTLTRWRDQSARMDVGSHSLFFVIVGSEPVNLWGAIGVWEGGADGTLTMLEQCPVETVGG
jgi:integrative and conjugative element protein (TIGR02256 family)